MIAFVQSPTLPEVREWAALHTKARCEKAVTAYLQAAHVPAYLPLATIRRTHGLCIRVSRVPLFPGYVFFDPTAIENRRIFECRKVAQVLKPSDAGALKRDLEGICRVLALDDRIRRLDRPLQGTPVEVASGALMGMTGELIRVEGESRLVLKIRFIGAAAELVIDEAFVRQI